MDKERLKRHIQKSDLTALEKRYLEKLVDAEHGQWISCEDRLPEPRQEVAVLGINSIGDVGFSVDWVGATTGKWQYWSGMREITHWMPLPEPPEV